MSGIGIGFGIAIGIANSLPWHRYRCRLRPRFRRRRSLFEALSFSCITGCAVRRMRGCSENHLCRTFRRSIFHSELIPTLRSGLPAAGASRLRFLPYALRLHESSGGPKAHEQLLRKQPGTAPIPRARLLKSGTQADETSAIPGGRVRDRYRNRRSASLESKPIATAIPIPTIKFLVSGTRIAKRAT
jgi:hypothetical protein